MTWAEVAKGDWTLPSGEEQDRARVGPATFAVGVVRLEAQPKVCEFVFSRNGIDAIGGLSQLKAQLDRYRHQRLDPP